MTVDNELQTTLATADLYQFFSIFLHLPTMEFVNGLKDGRIATDIVNILTELDFPEEQVQNIGLNLEEIKTSVGDPEEFLVALRREYTRLFTHPVKPEIGIYETIFLVSEEDRKGTPLFISPVAINAEQHYKNAGLKVDANFMEPADHFATQMEFMMFLHQKKASAITQNDNVECINWQKRIDDFYQEHIQLWAKDFFSKCQTVSENPAYNFLSTLGSIFFNRILV